MVYLNLLCLLIGNAAGLPGGNALLAHLLPRLNATAQLIHGHAIVGAGDLGLRAELDDGVIQVLILGYHGARRANLLRIGGSDRIPHVAAVRGGEPHLAPCIIVARYGQGAHHLLVDINRGTRAIERLALIHGRNGFFWNAWSIKEGARHAVQHIISLRLARSYLGKSIIFPLVVRIGALRFKLRLGGLLR